MTMLTKGEKTPYPDWAAPYTAIWEEGQWIVLFTDEHAAKHGRGLMLGNEGAPKLEAAPYPPNENLWYVGIAD
jgi:hypothetical protein